MQQAPPYSPINPVGNWYFISGQIGKDPTNRAPIGITGQTAQLFKNLDDVLARNGLHKTDIVKTTVYLTNMKDFETVNKAYRKYFSEPYPARSAVGVNELPRIADNPLLIEIDAIAFKQSNG